MEEAHPWPAAFVASALCYPRDPLPVPKIPGARGCLAPSLVMTASVHTRDADISGERSQRLSYFPENLTHHN